MVLELIDAHESSSEISQAVVFYQFSYCKVKEAQTWKKITDLEMNKQEIEELI